MRQPLLAGLLLALQAAPALAAQGPEKVIDVRAARPPAGNSFEAFWAAYKRAEARGDTEATESALREMRRLRIERNIRSLEPFALARVGQGLARLRKGELERAGQDFRGAMALDPYLPDAYFGLALMALKSGVRGMFPAIGQTLSGVTARLSTVSGRHDLTALLIGVILLALLATTSVLAAALLVRHGGLLRHDIEERLGTGRSPAVAPAVFAGLLALPVIAFQGYGWLPLWWLALLFIYLDTAEKVVAAIALLTCVPVGPVVKSLEARIVAGQNPVFGAGILAIEGGPDNRAIIVLEDAVRRYPDDRDLLYLLAAQYKKAGRYEDAAALYTQILQRDSDDAYALNNLANLSFAGGEFQAAIPRYLQAIESTPAAEVAATLYYNLSLAYLQKFEPQPGYEARSQADRLAEGLTRVYDALWKYEFKNENAVVDLGLTPEELWAKFEGVSEGIGRKNVAGKRLPPTDTVALLEAAANRFTSALALFGMVVLALSRWRGGKAFTMRCAKCGTAFCRRCHLGTVVGGLCTQCHHLFVVRDGVSGPARNQKLLEVQKEDQKRERIFRVLSLISPGAGHLYAHKTLGGIAFVFVWSLVLALALLAGRVLPLTEAPSTLARPWELGLIVLLGIYVAANRARPDFDVVVSAARPPRRGRAA